MYKGIKAYFSRHTRDKLEAKRHSADVGSYFCSLITAIIYWPRFDIYLLNMISEMKYNLRKKLDLGYCNLEILLKAIGDGLAKTKNKGDLNSLNLYLFDEQFPSSENVQVSFESECPPDGKVKLDDLFAFKRKRGDFLFSSVLLIVALFFMVSFFTETGWQSRKLPNDLGTYVLHQFGFVEIEGKVVRFGRILKQSWVGPLLCLMVLIPAAIWNAKSSFRVHRYRKRFLLPISIRYELEKYVAALEYVAYFILYTVLVPILGYLMSTVLLGVFLTWRVGYRTTRWILTGLLSSLIIVLVFRSFLQIKTPISIWLYDFLPSAMRGFMLTYF